MPFVILKKKYLQRLVTNKLMYKVRANHENIRGEQP